MTKSRLVRGIQKICFGLTALCCAFGVSSLNKTIASADDATRMANGVTFTSQTPYEVEESLTGLPLTYEAYVKLANDTDQAILGNRYDYAHRGTGMEINGGYLSYYYNNSAGSHHQIQFKDIKISDYTADYVHIAMTLDLAVGNAYCYINGELEATTSCYFGNYPTADHFAYTPNTGVAEQTIMIGGRYGSDTAYFRGAIKGVEAYYDIRTAEEIVEDYARMISDNKAFEDENAIFAYDLTASDAEYRKDISGNGNHLKMNGERITFRADTGLTFTSQTPYEIEKRFTGLPLTYEAYVKLANSNDQAILGNRHSYNSRGTGMEINGGYLSYYYNNGAGNHHQMQFKGINISDYTTDYIHIAMVLDLEDGVARCYINGEKKDEVSCYTNSYPDVEHFQWIPNSMATDGYPNGGSYTLMIGGRYGSDSAYFKGAIKGAEGYYDIRTAEEIVADYVRMTSDDKAFEDENAIFAYDFTASDAYYRTDISGNGNHLKMNGEKIQHTDAEHTFDQKATDAKYQVSAPTCTTGGVYYKSCACGEQGTETFTANNATGHDWVEVVNEEYLVKAPTCTDGAVYYKSCSVCGEASEETFTVDNATGHTWVEVVNEEYLVTAPTCTDGAVYYKSCSVCGEASEETFTVDNATGHTWNAGEVTKEAGPGVEGEITYTCTIENCGETKTETIPAWTSGVRYMSISTAGDIGLNFYIYLGDETETTATVTMNGNSVQVEGTYQESLSCWKYTYAVAPKDYQTKVTIQVLDITAEYSVAEYAEVLPEENEAYPIVVALMKYCEAARVYFANEVSAEMEDLTVDLSKYAATITGEEENVTIAGATLVLESETTINIYVTAENLVGINCTVNGITVTPEALDGQAGQYVISISGIVAKDLDEIYTIKVGGYTITYCALSYVEGTLSNTETTVTLANLVKTLYALSIEAEQYFNTAA